MGREPGLESIRAWRRVSAVLIIWKIGVSFPVEQNFHSKDSRSNCISPKQDTRVIPLYVHA